MAEPDAAAMRFADHHDMQLVFETACLYTGATPAIDLARTYGVTNLEPG